MASTSRSYFSYENHLLCNSHDCFDTWKSCCHHCCLSQPCSQIDHQFLFGMSFPLADVLIALCSMWPHLVNELAKPRRLLCLNTSVSEGFATVGNCDISYCYGRNGFRVDLGRMVYAERQKQLVEVIIRMDSI
uniref:Uncharacterized protein n=1 Tax=Daphnia galeata TaxID=27404 RepID=A0A8J2S0M5_9CRUS|nr:unnamed protein product [Daphnia galeata]